MIHGEPLTDVRCLQIDAFTDRPFAGNPAGVCLLEALGIEPSFVGRTKFDKLLVVDSEEKLRALAPE